MSKKQNDIILSDDGSHTLVSDQFGVTYHSTHGAIQESICVFLQAGLLKAYSINPLNINILEMGFGSGLNALLTLLESQRFNFKINYTTVEAYPISQAEVDQLNYLEVLDAQHLEDSFNKMHQIPSDAKIELSNKFRFTKHLGKMEEYTPKQKIDLVYYDAFAPTTQPELWDEAMMQHMYDLMSDESVLVSYCAKGSFKRALLAAGFTVEKIPGPPGKREMIRAYKHV